MGLLWFRGWVGLQLDPWYDLRLLGASKSVLLLVDPHKLDAGVKTVFNFPLHLLSLDQVLPYIELGLLVSSFDVLDYMHFVGPYVLAFNSFYQASGISHIEQ